MEDTHPTDGSRRLPRFRGGIGGTGSSWPLLSEELDTACSLWARSVIVLHDHIDPHSGGYTDRVLQRYVYPLIAPPTPERLEADKKSIDEQFEKAFALVDQLAKDTETLKAAEQQRTEKLDGALAELETVISDLKSSNRRREEEAQRIRDDVTNLKDSIPKAMDAQKNLTDTRLQEVNAELKSLKTIISQRMASQQASSANSYASRAAAPTPAPTPAAASSAHENGTNGATNGHSAAEEASKRNPGDQGLSTGRSSPFSSGISPAAVKIPEWQRAMAAKRSSSSMSTTNTTTADTGNSSQAEAGGSSS